MCGRATLSTPPDDLRELFGLDDVPQLAPRFNIAPTQPIAVMRDARRLELLRWGLALPESTHRRGAIGINVRAESVARVPAYRDAFRLRRCIVIVDGFFEWSQSNGKTKQPFFIHRADGRPFALAGIWDSSTTSSGEVVDACAVITADAQGVVKELHSRMPVIVPRAAFGRWLGQGAEPVADLLVPCAEGLVTYPVSTLVNSPANDDARCIERAGEGGEAQASLFCQPSPPLV